MIPILSGNVASALPSGYEIANSCRFNSGDSPSLKDGDGSAPAGNRQKFTFSVWFKRAKLGVTQMFAASAHSSSDEGYLYISGGDVLVWHHSSSGMGQMITNQKFRDVGAWYHLVWAVDTTQASAGNRMKFYINGTQITSWATETQPDEDKELYWNVGGTYYPWIGRRHGGDYFDGYMAEVVHIDNAQLAATSFGEFDEDSPTIWKPKDPSGLTFGTAGYWLDFEDSSNLGKDVSGQGNHFGTVANLAAIDQATDTPTNNFCVMNSLDNYIASSTFSEGNLKIVTPSSNYQYNTGTFGLTAGKWYFEMKMTTNATGDFVGIAGRVCGGALHMAGYYNDTWAYSSYDGKYFTNNTGSSYGDSWATDDTIIGVYIDLDNNKLYFAKNGTVQNSGTGISITDPASVTNGAYHPSVGDNWNGDSGTYHMNFGNPTYALSSAQSDTNGYGSFEYDPSSGTFDGSSKDFLAICSKNLGSDGG